MGVRLKGPAKFMIVLLALGLIYFAARMMGWDKYILGEKKAQQDVSEWKSKDADTIKVGIVTWGGYAGGLTANGGFTTQPGSIYADLGLKVQFIIIDDFEKSRIAFKNDDVDVLWSTVDSFALEYDGLKNFKPVVLLQNDWSRGGDAIAVWEGINTVENLKGKSIAVAEATPSHFFALYTLIEGGVSNTEVQWVFTKSAIDAANAFKSGSVDAAVAWSPDIYMAAEARAGGKILTSTKTATNLIADILITKQKNINTYPEKIKKFLIGWFKGVDQAKRNPERAINLMVSTPGSNGFNGVDYSTAKGMFSDVYLPSYAENVNFFSENGRGRTYNALFDDAQRLWKLLGSLKESIAPTDTKMPSLLAEIAPELQSIAGGGEKFDFKPVSTQELESKQKVLRKKISIYFDSGSAKLNVNAKLLLMKEVKGLLDTFANAYIKVSGNTDSEGGREMNIALSQKRAQAVVEYLVEKLNIPRARFVVQGNGPDQPVADNSTEEGREMNRRTDFEIISK